MARGVSERILIAFTPISQVMFPLISSGEPSRAKSYAQNTFRQLAGLAVPLAITVVILLPFLMPVVYGHAFDGAIILAQVLCVAFILLGISVPINLWLVGSLLKPGLNALVSAFTFAMVVVLGYTFTFRAGGTGMAVAMLVSFAASLAFCVWIGNINGLGLYRLLPNKEEFHRIVPEFRGFRIR